MAVGIIIPTYEHFEYAKLAIESASMTPDSVVVIVDDGSSRWPGERIVSGWLSGPYVIHRYTEHEGNLSRSWNAGVRICASMGLEYAVCSNADVVFPRGWWAPLEAELERSTFVGPVTNAPGHVRAQGVGRYIEYDLSDDPDDIQDTQNRCHALDTEPVHRGLLNGFTFAGRTVDYFRAGPGPFDEINYRVNGGEDDFFHRLPMESVLSIVPQSFVFHYRSVARGLRHGSMDRGHVRIEACSGCGKGGASP